MRLYSFKILAEEVGSSRLLVIFYKFLGKERQKQRSENAIQIENKIYNGCMLGWIYTFKINRTIGGAAFSEITETAIC